jgi:hypothetical protein
MTKDTILFMCSPDIHRLNSRRAINSVKTTDLSRAEFYVIDNAFDANFSHSKVMNDMLQHAAKAQRNAVILDDDIEICSYNWLDRLYQASDDLEADIVGCVHKQDNGKINHMGEYVCPDGLTMPITDFVHDPQFVKNSATYVPTLCSAILLIRNCHRYRIDLEFKKYKQDLDLCMQAWANHRKVGIALDLHLMHNRGVTGERNPNFARILSEDSAVFVRKWMPFLEHFYAIPELQHYKSIAEMNGWSRLLVRAARYRYLNTDTAQNIYQRIINECFEPEVLAGAYYHMYSLTGDIEYLVQCNRINPCHQMASLKLEEAGLNASKKCFHSQDCRRCQFLPSNKN